jgi:serine kinase of HPr protein (carbohydrate metabolism regulator)
MTPHIATCVAIVGRGILIEGASGSGKSTLALSLIDRGADLVGDDGVLLEAANGRLIAHPHPQTQGLLEIRNLGIVPFAFRQEVAIALIVLLQDAAPRYIEAALTIERIGVTVPAIAMWPGSSALKVEHALRLYGLPD